jgi:amino acid transporter
MGAGSTEARGLAGGIVGSARVTAFGASIVAPAASVITVLVVMVSYAGFASPLIILITFAGSLCCAFSIAEFARRVPSAGWAYTYNSRGLGPAAGFLTGWMMVFGYAMFVPAGIAVASAYASQLISADVFHVTIDPWVLFVVILAVAVGVAYLGIRTSSSADLILVAGEMAVLVALAITILVKIGPTPLARLSGRHTPVVAIGFIATLTLALGLPLTYTLGGASTAGYLLAAGGLAVVLVYLTGNIAVIRAFRTEFRDEFKPWRHLIIPAAAVVIFLFPLWGILHPPAYTLVNLLPFAALGWLCVGAIAATVLRARRPDSFKALGRVFMTSEAQPATTRPRP